METNQSAQGTEYIVPDAVKQMAESRVKPTDTEAAATAEEAKVEPVKEEAPVVSSTEPAKEEAPKPEGEGSEQPSEVKANSSEEEGKDSAGEEDLVAAYMKETYGEAPAATEGSEAKVTDTAAELPKEYKDLEELTKDPFIAYLLQAKANGVDVREDLKSILADDPNKYTEEEVFSMMLKAENIEGEDAEDALAEFSGMSLFQKKSTVKAYRQQLASEQGKKMELLKPAEVVDNSEELKAVVETARQNLNNIVTTNKGKEVYGMELTEDRAAKVRDYVENSAPTIYKRDGSIDVERMWNISVQELYMHDIIRSNVAKGVSLTKKNLILERQRPNGDSSGDKGTITGTSKSLLDQAIELSRKK